MDTWARINLKARKSWGLARKGPKYSRYRYKVEIPLPEEDPIKWFDKTITITKKEKTKQVNNQV